MVDAAAEWDVVWDSVPDAVVVVDDHGQIVHTNKAFQDLFRYEAGEIRGRSIELLVPEQYRGAHQQHRGRYERRPVRRPMGAGQLFGARRADGTEFPAHIALSPITTPAGTFTVAAVRDLSAWVEDQARLADATRRRMLAEDHERIARELHDTVIQELFAIGMALQAVQGQAEPPAVAERLAQAVDQLDDVISRIRRVIFDLSQPVRASRGLRSAVIDTVADLTPSLGFEPKLQLDGPLDVAVPDEVAEHVLATLREALSNVARHAKATGVEVLVSVDDRVRVVVSDDGTGIDPSVTRRSGLANLARRAELLGGELTVEPRPGGGTTVAWDVPLVGSDGG